VKIVCKFIGGLKIGMREKLPLEDYGPFTFENASEIRPYENRFKKMLRYILKARRIKSDICGTFKFKMEAKDGGVRAWITVFGVFLNYFFMFGFLRCFSVLIDPIIVQYETNYKGTGYSYNGWLCESESVTHER